MSTAIWKLASVLWGQSGDLKESSNQSARHDDQAFRSGW
jgi:hypothetical protein